MLLPCHYVAAACKELGIENVTSLPPESLPGFNRLPAREWYSFIMKLSNQVLDKCGGTLIGEADGQCSQLC